LKQEKLIGRTARGVLAAVTFSHLAQHFYVGVSVLYPDIMTSLSLSYTQLGVMTGTTSIISGFLQIAWSLLSRYVSKRVLLGIGNLLMSLGCLIMGRARGFIELIGGNVMSGSGQAAQHPVGTSIITQKFPGEKISRGLAIRYGLGYMGNIISPVLLSLIAVSMDWRQATFLLAGIPLMTGLAVLYYLSGEESALRSIQVSERSSIWEDIESAVRIKTVILIMAAQAFAVGGTGMGVIITYTPLFLRNYLRIEIFETSVIYSIAMIGGVLGTIVFGHLSNRVGNLKMAAAIVGSCSVLILLLTYHNSFTPILILHLFVIGCTSFAFSSLLRAHLASISTPRQRDIIMGMYFTLGFGVSSIWTSLTGFLIDLYGSFNPAWILRAVLGAIAFLLIVWASRSRPSTHTS